MRETSRTFVTRITPLMDGNKTFVINVRERDSSYKGSNPKNKHLVSPLLFPLCFKTALPNVIWCFEKY